MSYAIRWMAQNHVAANLLMLVFIVGGVILGLHVKQEVFPEVALDRVSVSVAYPGAGPEEVEEGVILKIEENLTGVDGIKQLKSVASEGLGTVIAEVTTEANVDLVMQDIKSEVDRIITFPRDAEKPVVSKLLNRREVLSIVVFGDLPERSLRELAEQIRDELLLNESITQVDVSGVRPYEIAIEIDEFNLRRYGLTFDQIAQRVQQASLDLPGGTIKTSQGEILVRTKERRYFGPEYAEIVILTEAGGTEVRLSDIADVRDSFEETDQFGLSDGQPAAMIKVYRVGDQKPTEISATVADYVANKNLELPETVSISVLYDSTELFESRKQLLMKNAFIGLLLVFFTLGLFLEIRLALWVMLGIPISFFGALLFMPAIGVSINMISLFAFIMALGIVVDDAIVIGENIYEHRQSGKPYLTAAIDGAIEVSQPVIFAILTSVTAFLPLLFTTGIMGKFILVIPAIVITILLVSLIECLFILPAHLAIGERRQSSGPVLGAIDRVRGKFSSFLQAMIRGPYQRLLDLCLRYRYATLAVAIAILLVAGLGIVGGGIVKFRFMPVVDGDVVQVSLEMVPGTPISRTAEIADHIVRIGQEVVAEFDQGRPPGDSVLLHIYSLAGGSIVDSGPGGTGSNTASNLSSIFMFLTPSEQRNLPATEITNRWRERVGEIAGVEKLSFTSNLIHLGANIDVQLAHEDFAVLAEASERLKQSIAAYPGTGDISDNYSLGKREVKLRLKPEARTLGITEQELGRQLRGAFYGSEALRLQRGRNEVKVMVRYPEESRKSLWDLEEMRIRVPSGGEIPLNRAAYIEEDFGFSAINRTDRKRVINVAATVDDKIANAEEILAEMKRTTLPKLVDDYPGLSYDLEGEDRNRRESMESMKYGFMFILFVIFALLAVSFRSYSQPALIMVAIPFGIVGAILGHLVMGFDLSILSMFGIVALTGVVINDSLLLIDFVNRSIHSGTPLHDAVLEAGQRRFRPILLTSLTTFFGLMPMILETSVQAQFLIPMAISLAFGIMFATGITLLLIPSLYLVLEDIRRLFGLSLRHARHDKSLQHKPS
ncbi:MAG: efflux RND transporter permease subunit [Deltaproteobacteria bacterium]|jgi:multidrug efflux pump subunit AcrB|nr:efflux RND transporter permease subunit [Deltaproteobacteria bacterium]